MHAGVKFSPVSEIISHGFQPCGEEEEINSHYLSLLRRPRSVPQPVIFETP